MISPAALPPPPLSSAPLRLCASALKSPWVAAPPRYASAFSNSAEFAIATVPICPDIITPMELLSEGVVLCPCCGETFSTMVDTSQSSHATIEDCPVCCRPIQLTVECEPGEVLSIDAQPG